MLKLPHAFVACTAWLLSAASANAQDDALSINAGYFDVLRREDSAALFGAEYRFDSLKYGLCPMIGGFVTTKRSAYGYIGLAWDLPVWKDKIYVVPNFAPGLYSKGGGKFLGGPVSFRTGFEIDYRFSDGERLGVAFNHMSNADIYRRNPSDENAIITYSIPVSRWLGL